jgi:hypothetical protein
METIKILESLTEWWDHPSKIGEIKSNYNTDLSSRNTLGSSLKYRLNSGRFSFLLDNNEILAYAGLLVDDRIAYCHRLAIRPTNFSNKKYRGIVPGLFIPYQIKLASQLNCHKYRLTFNEYNKSLYDWWKDRRWENSPFINVDAHQIISNFSFIGKQTIFQTLQYVCEIDLTRGDLNEFFRI